MKQHSEPKKKSKFPKKTSDSVILPQVSHEERLQDRISARRCDTAKGFQNAFPLSSVSHQSQWMGGKASPDELVRYMSNMPIYLERGKIAHDTVLSVGVLDWGRLEKWQYVHKVAPHRYSSYSSSCSNVSSSYSADESTSASSRGRGHSCSPGRQKMRHSLQFHLMASPLKDHSSSIKTYGESETKFEDLKFAKSNVLNKQNDLNQTHIPLPKSHPDTKLKQGREKELDVVSGAIYNVSSYQRNHREASTVKPPVSIKKGQSSKMEDKPQQQNLHVATPDAPVSPKDPASVPKELPEIKNPGVCHLSDSRPILGLRSEETGPNIFPDKICHTKISSDTSQSCLVSEEKAVTRTNSRVQQQGGVDKEKIYCSSDAHSVESQSAKAGISSSAIGNSEKKISSATPTNELSKGLDSQICEAIVVKPRSPSSFRRLSISITKVGKSFSTKEDGAVPQSISKSKITKYNPGNGIPPACSYNLSYDRPDSAARSRSSPLRRLLDPLLKPKGSNCHRSTEPLQKYSAPVNGASKSSNAQVEHSSIQSMKARLDTSSRKTIGISVLGTDKKNKSLTFQALVRVAFKNGLPLITFAVGNDSSLLIATIKKSDSLDKDQRSWVYTIFDVQDVKKKNGSWRSQGGKGKDYGYVSNAVAEMNVYDSQSSNSTKRDFQRLLGVRQFVVFSLDEKQADGKTSECQPNDEVAAIVVKIPEEVVEHSIRDDGPDTSDCYSDLRLNMQNVMFPDSQDPINATVILPSGTHSLPSRGIPSTLIDRWKSGGSCDCGGWDLGCKLTILSNQNPLSKKLTLSKACSISSNFELFSQGGQQNEPLFSLASLKDETFSVEFNSSLSLLQAFSVCIAILDSRKLFDLPNPETKAVNGSESIQNNGTQTESGIPARYVSYPPLSPVGRV